MLEERKIAQLLIHKQIFIHHHIDNTQLNNLPFSQTRSTSWNITSNPAERARYTLVVLNHIMRLNVSKDRYRKNKLK